MKYTVDVVVETPTIQFEVEADSVSAAREVAEEAARSYTDLTDSDGAWFRCIAVEGNGELWES